MANGPPSFNKAYIYATPLHPISFTYSRMHIYPWQIDPPANQPYIYATLLHPVSLPIEVCTYTHGRQTPPIDHTSMQHHYTNKFQLEKKAHIPIADGPPCQLTIHLCNTITPNKSPIAECKYTHGRWTPCQLTIDLCNTITPSKFHL